MEIPFAVPKLHAQLIPFNYGGNQPESHIYISYPSCGVMADIELKIAPADFQFHTTNQTRHWFTCHIEFHSCSVAKGRIGAFLSILNSSYVIFELCSFLRASMAFMEGLEFLSKGNN